jgi:hypothetical protein
VRAASPALLHGSEAPWDEGHDPWEAQAIGIGQVSRAQASSLPEAVSSSHSHQAEMLTHGPATSWPQVQFSCPVSATLQPRDNAGAEPHAAGGMKAMDHAQCQGGGASLQALSDDSGGGDLAAWLASDDRSGLCRKPWHGKVDDVRLQG